MYSPRTKLPTPADYEFPHEPYGIQQQLMESLYAVLEQKGVGIFESPTGTGKSLTLTCGALRWLEDHEALVRQDLQQRIAEVEAEIKSLSAEGEQAADWITAQYSARKEREELHELRSLAQLLQQHEQRLGEMKERCVVVGKKRRNGLKRTRNSQTESPADAKIDDSDEEQLESHDTGAGNEGDKPAEEAEQRYRDVQIFFCSRTHSQLAQVVREVKKTAYGRRIRCVSLASRQQLCIHPQVRRLPGAALINERCLDMARNDDTKGGFACAADSSCTKKKVRGDKPKCCTFKATQLVQQLEETTLMEVLDIEELVEEGEQLNACPYYAARAATKTAQLVMLPYQMLLHRRTRLQSGIDLRGAVVIIDEAHNLLDTIGQLHSCELTLPQLLVAQQQVFAYKLRYVSRFSSANLLRINQLLFVVKRLIKLLQPKLAEGVPGAVSRMLRTYELTGEGDFFNIDLFQLLEFCERSRFVQKLQGFAQRQLREEVPSENQPPANTATVNMLQRLQQEHQQRQLKRPAKPPATAELQQSVENKSGKGPTLPPSSPIRPLLAFLSALTEDAEDGRVLVSVDSGGDVTRCAFKYILLNPGGHFQDVLTEARAIIVAGGTMQPTNELTEQLFRSCAERVQLHFYDHVVPADAVLPFAVSRGPSGHRLCFNFAQRGSREMLTELHMILQNLSNVLPGGVVCFLPSYEYLDAVYAHIQQSSVLAQISSKKRVFREPRTTASAAQSVEQLLAAYTAAIASGQGALLLSVVGGKLSEGLNFADDLGRGVIVVGLPYPNRHSPELQERIKYLDSKLGAGAGNEYYENLCMKAVNQCIGRSVRHIRDYACVFLLDERYSNERIQKKLPQWIARSLQTPSAFGAIQAATARFFKLRRQP